MLFLLPRRITSCFASPLPADPRGGFFSSLLPCRRFLPPTYSPRQWVRHFTGPHAPHPPKSACGGRQVLQPGLESPACQPDSRTDDTLDRPNQNLLLLCPHRFCYTVMYLMKPPSSHECRPFPVHLQRQSRLARQHPRITCVQ